MEGWWLFEVPVMAWYLKCLMMNIRIQWMMVWP